MTTEDLTCRELVTIVTDYLDGALTEADTRRFDRHLTSCDGCTTYLEQFRQTIDLSGRLEPTDLEPRVQDDLLTAFRTWKTRR